MKKLAILLIVLVCVSFVVKMSEPKTQPSFKTNSVTIRM